MRPITQPTQGDSGVVMGFPASNSSRVLEFRPSRRRAPMRVAILIIDASTVPDCPVRVEQKNLGSPPSPERIRRALIRVLEHRKRQFPLVGVLDHIRKRVLVVRVNRQDLHSPLGVPLLQVGHVGK